MTPRHWRLARFVLVGGAREVVTGCYLMLMVLAEAVARPLPGEDPRPGCRGAAHPRTRCGVASPDAGLSHPSATCLERAGDAEAAHRERTEAEPLEPAGAFDRFLLGQDATSAAIGRPPCATSSGDRGAVRPVLGPVPLGHLLPELLSVAPGEAKAALTACLRQRSSFAWLYLLRGVAFGQMGGSNSTPQRGCRPGPTP